MLLRHFLIIALGCTSCAATAFLRDRTREEDAPRLLRLFDVSTQRDHFRLDRVYAWQPAVYDNLNVYNLVVPGERLAMPANLISQADELDDDFDTASTLSDSTESSNGRDTPGYLDEVEGNDSDEEDDTASLWSNASSHRSEASVRDTNPGVRTAFRPTPGFLHLPAMIGNPGGTILYAMIGNPGRATNSLNNLSTMIGNPTYDPRLDRVPTHVLPEGYFERLEEISSRVYERLRAEEPSPAPAMIDYPTHALPGGTISGGLGDFSRHILSEQIANIVRPVKQPSCASSPSAGESFLKRLEQLSSQMYERLGVPPPAASRATPLDTPVVALWGAEEPSPTPAMPAPATEQGGSGALTPAPLGGGDSE